VYTLEFARAYIDELHRTAERDRAGRAAPRRIFRRSARR
jgi:hypothetical protein